MRSTEPCIIFFDFLGFGLAKYSLGDLAHMLTHHHFIEKLLIHDLDYLVILAPQLLSDQYLSESHLNGLGGIEARVLFLFEKPGPMTADEAIGKRPGSGFISRDNDDPTAEAVFNFMRQADIPRELTILWNVIPWWNVRRGVERLELLDGARAFSN